MSDLPKTGSEPKPKKSRDNATRRALLDEAVELFDQLGYVYVRDVMSRVGVKEPTIYYYFGNKENLYIEVVKRKIDQLFRALQTATSQPDLTSQLIEVTLVFLEGPTNRVRMLRDVIAQVAPTRARPLIEALDTGLPGNIERIFREAIRRGDIQPGEVVLYTRFFLYVVEGFANEPRPSLPDLSPRQKAEQIVALFLQGILTSKS